ncbi:MAG: PRC-barrel domain-containing protein [Anaerolineae bacterium]|nr:PRC-barrel domain-containing protein [Anaerolineae bacterium]
MIFRANSQVWSEDGQEVGQIDRVVINPKSRAITHLVVRHGILFREDKLIPIEWAAAASDQQVRLGVTVRELEHVPSFDEADFAMIEDAEWEALSFPSGMALPMYGYPPTEDRRQTAGIGQHLPKQALDLKERARVISSDGAYVGSMVRLVVKKATEEATHLVIAQGLFFRVEKTIPIEWVNAVEADEIHLSVSTEQLKLVSIDPLE